MISSSKQILLNAGESLLVKLGAMQAFSEQVTFQTGVHTSWSSAAFRALLISESILLNKFSAPKKDGWITLEEPAFGQIIEHTLKPSESLILKIDETSKSPFLACSPHVTISPSLTGIHGYLANIGFWAVKASLTEEKTGRFFFQSPHVKIQKHELSKESGSVTFDNKNIVAYSGSLSLETVFPGTLFSKFFGEEGIATRFSGSGTVYISSNPPTL